MAKLRVGINGFGRIGRILFRHGWDRVEFVGINNLFGNDYISTVTINGRFNRTLEPAPLRNFYVGGEISFRALSR